MHHHNNIGARKHAHGTFLQLNTYVGENSKAIQWSWKLIKLLEQKKSDEKQKSNMLIQSTCKQCESKLAFTNHQEDMRRNFNATEKECTLKH